MASCARAPRRRVASRLMVRTGNALDIVAGLGNIERATYSVATTKEGASRTSLELLPLSVQWRLAPTEGRYLLMKIS
jgi:hypothetical protein